MRATPYDLMSVAERFPLSIEDFRKLKDYPKSQLRVAHFLLATDEETRKKVLNHPGSKWRVEDTYVLAKALRENPSFKNEVVKVVVQASATAVMEVD